MYSFKCLLIRAYKQIRQLTIQPKQLSIMWTLKPRNPHPLHNSSCQQQFSYQRDSLTDTFARCEKAKVEVIKQHISNLKKTKQSMRVIWNPNDSQVSNQEELDQEPVEFRKTLGFWVEDESDTLAPVFSPYKEKSKRRYSQNPTAMNWTMHEDRGRESKIKTEPEDSMAHHTRQRFKTLNTLQAKEHNTRMRPSAPKRPQLNSKSSKQLVAYNNGIGILKELYDLVSEITFSAKNNPYEVAKLTKRYLDCLFSKGLTFIDSFINRCEIKLRRILLLSRLMESVSIAYLMLQILKNSSEAQEANIVNFVGHCASNLILLSRLYILANKKGLGVFPDSSFQACIGMFEMSTFKEQLHSISNVTRRIQHNNEIIAILQAKTGRLNPRFSLSTRKLTRTLEKQPNSSWLLCHHLFQYLAFYLHDIGLNGKIEYLDCAPSPFVNSSLNPPQHRYTVLLQPHGVLFLYKKQNISIRSFSRQFLEYVQKHFQLIIWTWMMPEEIEPVMGLIFGEGDRKENGMLYRYHCKYENKVYTKDLTKLGREVDHVLIIDYDRRIYGKTPHNGVELAWDGKPGDTKLLDLTQILLQMLTSGFSVKDTLQIYSEQVSSLSSSQQRS